MSVEVTTEDPYDWEEQKPRIVATVTSPHAGESVTLIYTQDKDEAIAKMEAFIAEARYALERIRGIE